MKNVILFVPCNSAIGCAQSKTRRLPKVVIEAFKKISNTKVDWDIERIVLVEFKMDGKEASANYDKLGHKLTTEMKSKKLKCHQKALTYVSTISNKKIKETAKIIDDKGINYL
jgi:hypothetical protein